MNDSNFSSSNSSSSGDNNEIGLISNGSPGNRSNLFMKQTLKDPTTSFSFKAFQTITESRVSQLKAITLPNNQAQIAFLNSLNNFEDPQTLAQFLDYLIQQISSTALDKSKYISELKSTKEELNIAKNRSQRLLLHLQQNIKLLTQVATNEGETTLIQEATQNLKSISPLESGNATDYLKNLSQVLSTKKDPNVGLEAIELLKQEISINSILRHQTQKLNDASAILSQQIQTMKTQIGDFSPKQIKNLKLKLDKQNNLISKITSIANCSSDELEATLNKLINKANQLASVQAQVQQIQNEAKEKITKMKEENENIEKELLSYKKKLSTIQKMDPKAAQISKELSNLLNMSSSPKNFTNYEILINVSSKALPFIKDAIECHQKFGLENHKSLAFLIEDMNEEIVHLKDVQRQNQKLMKQQAETIQTLQETSINWQTPDDHSSIEELPKGKFDILEQVSPDNKDGTSSLSAESSQLSPEDLAPSESNINESSFEFDAQFCELDQIRKQFSSLGKEIETLQSQLNGSQSTSNINV